MNMDNLIYGGVCSLQHSNEEVRVIVTSIRKARLILSTEAAFL